MCPFSVHQSSVVQSPIKLPQYKKELWLHFCTFSVRFCFPFWRVRALVLSLKISNDTERKQEKHFIQEMLIPRLVSIHQNSNNAAQLIKTVIKFLHLINCLSVVDNVLVTSLAFAALLTGREVYRLVQSPSVYA